mgnify:CR=1 FL=1
MTVEDSLGRQVSLSKVPDRIVTTIPNTTEIILNLELTDKVVGVTALTSYLSYAPEIRDIAEEKEKVGKYNVSTEKISSLQPDLVVVDGLAQRNLLQQLENLGIPVYAANPKDIADIEEVVLELGYLTGKLETARQIISDMELKRLKLKQAVSELESRKSTLYIISSAIYTTGGNTFQGQLLELAGLENIFSDISGFKKVSDETIIKRNPELIISGPHGTVGLTMEKIRSRPGFRTIEAVKTESIIFLTKKQNSMISQPGTRVVDGAIKLFELAYDRTVKNSAHRSGHINR